MSYYCCSVAELYPTVCDPMNCTTPSFPVLHYLPEFAQTHIHQVGDAIPLGCLIVSQNCHFLKPDFWSSLITSYFSLLNFSYMKCNNDNYILPVAQDKTLESFCFSPCIQTVNPSKLPPLTTFTHTRILASLSPNYCFCSVLPLLITHSQHSCQ